MIAPVCSLNVLRTHVLKAWLADDNAWKVGGASERETWIEEGSFS